MIDFSVHQYTYKTFIKMIKILLITIFNIIICLLFFTFGGKNAIIVGFILLFFIIISCILGINSNYNFSWKPPFITTIVISLCLILVI